jgi:hypothetical protein
MKFRVLSAGLGLLAASVALAQMSAPPVPPTPANPSPGSPPANDGSGSAPAPTAPAPAPSPAPTGGDATAKKNASKTGATDTKKAPAKKKEDPPATIDGVAITRPNGGFLGLQILNNNFVLTFYDAKKKKVAPDVARAALRWPVKYQPGPERTVLNPSGGFALASAKDVRPPFTFKVFISLFVEGKDDPVESYTVDYHG